MLVILVVFNHTLNCEVSLPASSSHGVFVPTSKVQLHMQTSGLTAHISLGFKALQTQIPGRFMNA